MSYKKKLTTKIFGSRKGSEPDKSLEGRAHFVTRAKKEDGEEAKARENASMGHIDGYYRNKMSQRRANQSIGMGQAEDFDEDDHGNNFDAQRYQSIHGNEFSESNRRRRSNLIFSGLDNMDEDDADMRPVDPNDFFRDRDEQWAGGDEDDDADMVPRSGAVTDNLFDPEEERKGEFG